jgi:hypothetical protein
MVAVIIIILASFGGGSFYRTAVANPYVLDDELGYDRAIRFFSLLYLFAHVLGPCMLVFLLISARDWMHSRGAIMAEGLFYVGMLGLGLWTISGTLWAGLMPATPRILDDPAQETTIMIFIRSASAGFLDVAFMVISLHSIGVGVFAWRQGWGFLGQVGLLTGISMLVIGLLGPFDRLNPLGVYGYGAPIFYLFTLSATLLYQADALEDHSTESHP